MNNTFQRLAAGPFVHHIPLASGRGRKMWAEFTIDKDGWTVRFYVRRNGRTGMWYGLDQACADYERQVEATSFVVTEGRG